MFAPGGVATANTSSLCYVCDSIMSGGLVRESSSKCHYLAMLRQLEVGEI